MTNYPINRITSEKSVLFCLALSLSSILYIYYTPTHTHITQSKNRIFSHFFPITNVCLYTSRTHDILYGDDNGLELIQFHYSFSFPQRYVTLRSTFIVQAFNKWLLVSWIFPFADMSSSTTKHIYIFYICRDRFIKRPPHIHSYHWTTTTTTRKKSINFHVTFQNQIKSMNDGFVVI